MASSLRDFATVMLQDSAARAAQARAVHEAQRAVVQANDERAEALHERIVQLEASREQDRASWQGRIAVLEQTVTSQGELIQRLVNRLGVLEAAHRDHTHGYSKFVEERTDSPRLTMSRVKSTNDRTSPPQ